MTIIVNAFISYRGGGGLLGNQATPTVLGHVLVTCTPAQSQLHDITVLLHRVATQGLIAISYLNSAYNSQGMKHTHTHAGGFGEVCT